GNGLTNSAAGKQLRCGKFTMRDLLTPVGWNEVCGEESLKRASLLTNLSLKNKWYQSPLHLFHILIVAVQFLPEHFFFTYASDSNKDNQQQSHRQSVNRAEQKRCADKKQRAAGIHRVPHNSIQSG